MNLFPKYLQFPLIPAEDEDEEYLFKQLTEIAPNSQTRGSALLRLITFTLKAVSF